MTSGGQELLRRIEAAADVIWSGESGRRVIWHAWGEGPPVVLLHGDFGAWTHFVRNIEPLSRRFRLLVPDMPGYGGSDLPAEPRLPPEIATPLAEGLDELLPAGAPLDIIGFSYGGMVGSCLAARLGTRVRRLVLSGPGGFGLGDAAADLTALRAVRSGMTPAEIAEVHRHNLALLMFAERARIDDLAVHIQAENGRLARVRCGNVPRTSLLLEVLPEVRAHLFGLWGERDAFAGPADRTTIEAELRRFDPGLDFRVVPGAGHWLFYERPEIVNAWLVEMLAAESAVRA